MKSSRRKAASSSGKPPTLVPSLLPAFLSKLSDLQEALSSFRSSYGFAFSFLTPMQIFIEWLEADCERYENQTLAGQDPQSTDTSERKTPQEILLSTDVFSGLNLAWRIRFNSKALGRFSECSGEKEVALVERLLELAQGQFEIGRKTNILQCGPMKHLIVLSSQFAKGGILLFALELNRIPVTGKGRLLGFEFHHFLRVVDVLPCLEEISRSLKQYVNLLRSDPAKRIQAEEKTPESRLVSLDNSVEVRDGGAFGPKRVSGEGLKRTEQYSFQEQLGRWVSSTERLKDCWESTETSLANAALVSELADSASCKGLIDFLQCHSDSFPFHRNKDSQGERTTDKTRARGERTGLSDEELDVIGTSGNVIVIGRSGTGKTTCSVLRILAGQALFRLRLKQQNHAVSGFFGLHSVFITASPTLAIEVKRFYDEIIARLSNKEVTEPDPNLAEDETELNEKDLFITSSTLLMTHADFPLFSTPRLLLYAIDAGLRNPFFQVSEEGEGVATQAGFHNELKGVKIISHLIRREELDENFDFQAEEPLFQASSTPLKPANTDLSHIISEQTNFEVDFDYFDRHFWPTVRDRCAFSSALVWAEIAGKLKGSCSSSAFSGGHISKEAYMTQHIKTSLLGQAEREVVWAVFCQYEKWKERKRAYDFQDVVTHALKEISLSGYEGTPIHFLAVDEVQDLTQATLLLLGKITEQQLFLSGDTAQTIAKGVNFRFKDMGALFSAQDGLGMEKPTMKQLKVNFRTHKRVLQVANCVVRVIELMFPKTIDKLEPEHSEIDGDMPILLLNPCLNEVVNALVVGEAVSGRDIVFGSGQVVLVPNEAARDRLPEILRGALCLTIYESKGLEFDDVVLYEFFENCGVPEGEWRLLREVLYKDEVSPADIFHPNWRPSFLATFESYKHTALCTALKMLYVAITRTKQKFIIYDRSGSSRHLLDYMLASNIITLKVTEETGLSPTVSEVIRSPAGKVLWRNLGIKLIKMKFYLQAAKCFGYADDQLLKKKAESLHIADESARLLQAAEAILSEQNSSSVAKSKAEKDKAQAISQFVSVAPVFVEIKQIRYAAQCYYSGQMYKRAATLYKALNAFNEIGHCLFAAGAFEDSGRSFRRAGNLLEALRAYDKGKFWVECIKVIKEISLSEQKRKVLTLQKRVALIRKYCRMVAERFVKKPARTAEGEFVPEAVELTKREKESLMQCYCTEDQPVQVTGEMIDDWASIIAASSQPDCGYGYSYLELSSLRPSGQVIELNAAFNSEEVIKELIAIAKLIEKDAYLIVEKCGGKALTGSFNTLPENLHAIIALEIYEVFRLKKLSFLLSCAIGSLIHIKSGFESQCIAVSPVHLISKQEHQRQPKLAPYFTLIAGAVTHQCLELIQPKDLQQIAALNDTIYAGLIVLGYWKKVVSLSTCHRGAVASVFRDFKHVKLNYLGHSRVSYMGTDSSNMYKIDDDNAARDFFLLVFEETLWQANRLIPVTMQSNIEMEKFSFHRRFSRNAALWAFLQNPREGATICALNEAILVVRKELRTATERSQTELSSYQIVDVFSFFAELLFSMDNDAMCQLMTTESFGVFEEVLLAFEFWSSLLDFKAAGGFVRGYDLILRGSLMPFAGNLLSGNDFFAGFPVYSHAIIRSTSFLFPELLKNNTELLSVDTEGLAFLVPISSLTTALRASAVRKLTYIVLQRKEQYVKNRFSSEFPFKESDELYNERLRAKTAACIYGELAQLRKIQVSFPKEFPFVGKLGKRLKEGNAQKISSLRMQISELSGEEYAADDPDFARFLRNKNHKKIKELTEEKARLLNRGHRLLEEEKEESELDDLINALPLDIHHELLWMFEPRIQLTPLAYFHLRAYIVDEMKDFNSPTDTALSENRSTDVGQLRMLDNVSRLCGCQPLLRSLAGDSFSELFFPEAAYSAGRLVEVIGRLKNLITFSPELDIKDKFQVLLKCILWSFVVECEKILLPKLLALQLTRYYGKNKKVLKKRFLPERSPWLLECIIRLKDLISIVQKSDPCADIAHTVMLILITVLVNGQISYPLLRKVHEVLQVTQLAKLGKYNETLGKLIQLEVTKLKAASELMKQSKSIKWSLKKVGNQSEEASQFAFSDWEPSPLSRGDEARWRDFDHSPDLEFVQMSSPLALEESRMQQATFENYQLKMNQCSAIDENNAMVWSTEEPIRQCEDLLLLTDFYTKIQSPDVYGEYWMHFMEEFAMVQTLGKTLASQLDLYHHKAITSRQRQMAYSLILLVAKSSIKLKHALLRALLACSGQHSIEAGAAENPETQNVKEIREEANRVVWRVSHADLNSTGKEVEEWSDILMAAGEAGMKWKDTRRARAKG